jgi:hypothetical protein
VSKIIFLQLWRFLLVFFLQTFVLDRVDALAFVNPSIYVYFLLLLPREWPHFVHILLGFAVGYSVDAFGDSAGIHTSSAVFLGFIAPMWLNTLNQREQGDEVGAHGPDQLTSGQFLLYALPLVWAHQIFLFSVEYLDLGKVPSILYYGTINAFFTGILVFILRFFPSAIRKNKSR